MQQDPLMGLAPIFWERAIFSWLDNDPKAIGNAAQVCEAWQRILSAESIRAPMLRAIGGGDAPKDALWRGVRAIVLPRLIEGNELKAEADKVVPLTDEFLRSAQERNAAERALREGSAAWEQERGQLEERLAGQAEQLQALRGERDAALQRARCTSCCTVCCEGFTGCVSACCEPIGSCCTNLANCCCICSKDCCTDCVDYSLQGLGYVPAVLCTGGWVIVGGALTTVGVIIADAVALPTCFWCFCACDFEVEGCATVQTWPYEQLGDSIEALWEATTSCL